MSPARRRQCVLQVQHHLGISKRFTCRVLDQHRSTQRKMPRGRPDEADLTEAIIELASEYGRYGYRRIWSLLRDQGWNISVSRMARIVTGSQLAEAENSVQ